MARAKRTSARGGGAVIAVALKVGDAFYRPTLYFARRETHAPGPVNVWHSHAVFHVVYVEQGAGIFRLDDRRIEAGPGTLFFIRPNQWHQFFALGGEPFRYSVVTFDLTTDSGDHCEADFGALFSETEREWITPLLRPGAVKVPPALEPALQAAFAEVIPYPAGGWKGGRKTGRSELKVVSFLHALGEFLSRLAPRHRQVSGAAGEETSRRKLVDQAVKFMNENYSKPLHLDEIAGRFHLHPVYFSQIFKEEIGVPPRQYLLRIRLNHARRLLLETDRTIGDIAHTSGFRTVTYFSRVFREVEGVSPSTYRRLNPPAPRVTT